jgi:D-apionolactonase
MEKIPEKEFINNGGFATADPVEVHAGALKAFYRNGSLRYISAGKRELIRMIYPAIRDSNWLTLEPEIDGEKIVNNHSSFSVSIRCHYRNAEIDFLVEVLIEGKEDNSICLSMSGEALTSFWKNRIGFCVLHPVEGCAGTPCTVVHPDGTKSQKSFPELINPDQVFLNIAAMEWTAADSQCSLAFEGEIFETEDQRNWTDASFKTYSTPLALPYPVWVEKGTLIRQKVLFRVNNTTVQEKDAGNIVRIKINNEKSKKLPALGIGRASRRTLLSEKELRIIKAAGFDHLRMDIHLFIDGWELYADESVSEAEQLSCGCEMAFFFSDNFREELGKLMSWLKKQKSIKISCCLVYHKDHPATPALLADIVIPALLELKPEISTGTGTNANFAELNRLRPGDGYANTVCFSIHPQEHASDNQTLVENLAAQSMTVRSALCFADKRCIRISPVNIRRRFNANLTFYEEPSHDENYPANTDARIMSLFGACWTAISLKYICESEVAGVTYFETAGERGIIQGDHPSRWPADFPASAGTIFPVYNVFRFILGHRDFRVLKSLSSNPLISDSLVLSNDESIKMILVNFTGREQRVDVSGVCRVTKLLSLDQNSYIDAAGNPDWISGSEKIAAVQDDSVTLQPWSLIFAEGVPTD